MSVVTTLKSVVSIDLKINYSQKKKEKRVAKSTIPFQMRAESKFFAYN